VDSASSAWHACEITTLGYIVTAAIVSAFYQLTARPTAGSNTIGRRPGSAWPPVLQCAWSMSDRK